MLGSDRRELGTYATDPLPFYPVMQRLKRTSGMLSMPSAEELLKPVETTRDTLTSAVSCFQERKTMPIELYLQRYSPGECLEHSTIQPKLPDILEHLVHNVAHANQRTVRIERAGWTQLRPPHCYQPEWLAKELYVHLVLTGALMPDERACVKIEEVTNVHTKDDGIRYIESVRTWSVICDFYMKGL